MVVSSEALVGTGGLFQLKSGLMSVPRLPLVSSGPGLPNRKQCLTIASVESRSDFPSRTQTRVTKNAAVRKKGGMEMAEALQINFALWGMIVCAVIKISQLAAAV